MIIVNYAVGRNHWFLTYRDGFLSSQEKNNERERERQRKRDREMERKKREYQDKKKCLPISKKRSALNHLNVISVISFINFWNFATYRKYTRVAKEQRSNEVNPDKCSFNQFGHDLKWVIWFCGKPWIFNSIEHNQNRRAEISFFGADS